MLEGRSAKPPIIVACAVAGCFALGGCSNAVELYTGLTEPDANDIVATLSSQRIEATKTSAKQGFVITVPQDEFGPAISLLRTNGLPRSAYAGMGDVFKKDGMISTPTEERARYIYALSQELERTLTGIDGIVMARVHPVLPERLAPGEPVQVASCAVLVKYRPGWDSSLYEDRIRRLVISGIPGLSNAPSNNVSIVFVQADPGLAPPSAVPAPAERSPRGAAQALTVLALVTALAAAVVALCWDWLRPRVRPVLDRQTSRSRKTRRA